MLQELYDHSFYILFVVMHATGFALSCPALLHTQTPQGSIAWVISLICFPWIAVPLFLILGPRRFDGYIKIRRNNLDKNDDLHNTSHSVEQKLKECLALDLGDRASLFSSLGQLSNLSIYKGNACRLLVDAQEAYAAIYEAIEHAQEYILVEFYIIKNDLVGATFRELLLKCAAKGIRIYVIYDEIGSHKLPSGYIRSMRQAGIHIQPFYGKRFFLRNIVRVNFRDHRKIVVVDGKTAYVGGMNIGMDYIGKGELGYWRDTFLEFTGPAVLQTQLAFLENWHWSSENLANPIDVKWEFVRQPQDTPLLIIPSGPADQVPLWRTTIIALANAAQKRLWIASPYFVPDEATFSSFQAAALRGVDVRILKPEKVDHAMIKFSSMTFLPGTVPFGIKIYHYAKGFMHQKVVLVDDDIASVGTANLDNRSLSLNFEITALAHDPTFAKKVANMLEQDFADARLVSPDEYNSQSIPYKIICNFFRLLAPVQ